MASGEPLLLDQVNDLFGSTAAAVVIAVIGRCTVLRCWVPLNDREPPAWIPKRSGYREREAVVVNGPT